MPQSVLPGGFQDIQYGSLLYIAQARCTANTIALDQAMQDHADFLIG